jgi:hypothetical protein
MNPNWTNFSFSKLSENCGASFVTLIKKEKGKIPYSLTRVPLI